MPAYSVRTIDLSAERAEPVLVGSGQLVAVLRADSPLELRLGRDGQPFPVSGPLPLEVCDGPVDVYITNEPAAGVAEILTAGPALRLQAGGGVPVSPFGAVPVELADRLDAELDSVTVVTGGAAASGGAALDALAIVPGGVADSGEIDLQGVAEIAAEFPAAFDGATWQVLGSPFSGGPYVPLADAAGAAIAPAVVLSSAVIYPARIPYRFIIVRSAAVQAAARQLRIVGKL